MIDISIAIHTLLDGPHPALWDTYLKRETMRFLRKRGMDIGRKDLSRLLRTILAGPPRNNYQRMEENDWVKLRDHHIRQRLLLLTESGVKLTKRAQNKLEMIQRAQPWEPQEDRSGEFPIFVTTRRGSQHETGEMVNFSTKNIESFIEWSVTQRDKRWDCSGGWFLFCENEPDEALQLLQMAGERNIWPIAPWYDALSRFQKNSNDIPKRHKKDTAQILLGMPDEPLGILDLQASRWLEENRKGLGKGLRRRLWKHLWEASLITNIEEPLDYDATLNYAGGILASVLMDELIEYHPTAITGENPGFFKHLAPYFKLIEDGETSSAKLARIRLSANLLYLFRVDREFTKNALLSRMDSESRDNFEPGLWEGYLWSPRIYDDLLEPLKPIFFRILENLDLISQRVHENATQLFIDISVPPDRGVTTKEAQKVLQDMPSQNLAEAASRLRLILAGAGEKAPILWHETIEPWFKKAWPKHEDAKSRKTSSSLAWMAIETGEAFPDAVITIKDQLKPSRWGDTLHNIKEANIQKRFPKAVWTLIKHTIGDDTEIAGLELQKILDEISHEWPDVTDDAYFQRLRARG